MNGAGTAAGTGAMMTRNLEHQPVHKRTTSATEQALKGPAMFMREIRGALDDLKALSKLQLDSPRGKLLTEATSPRSNNTSRGSPRGSPRGSSR
jgi:hypothetical protein